MSRDCEKLKSCPFCGSENLRIPKAPKFSNDFTTYEMLPTYVCCTNCGSSGATIAYVDDVIKAWNERK